MGADVAGSGRAVLPAARGRRRPSRVGRAGRGPPAERQGRAAGRARRPPPGHGGHGPDAVISSPKLRAFQTARIVAAEIGAEVVHQRPPRVRPRRRLARRRSSRRRASRPVRCSSATTPTSARRSPRSSVPTSSCEGRARARRRGPAARDGHRRAALAHPAGRAQAAVERPRQDRSAARCTLPGGGPPSGPAWAGREPRLPDHEVRDEPEVVGRVERPVVDGRPVARDTGRGDGGGATHPDVVEAARVAVGVHRGSLEPDGHVTGGLRTVRLDDGPSGSRPRRIRAYAGSAGSALKSPIDDLRRRRRRPVRATRRARRPGRRARRVVGPRGGGG